MRKIRIARVVVPAMVLTLGVAPAFADPNTKTPNPSAQFGQAGSAEAKLEAANERFGTDHETIGSFMSEHVQSYSETGPGRSGLAPNSDNAHNRNDR